MCDEDKTRQQIKQKSLDLLARSELTRIMLARKLENRDYSATLVAQVIDELAEHGWQSDQRYLEHYIAMRSGKGFGPLRIQVELEQRGIDTVSASETLQTVQWSDVIARAYRRKYATSLITGWPEQAKRMRFLQYRGFTAEQINDFMKTLNQASDDESGY